MSNTTTIDRAAELYKDWTDGSSKWTFMDFVHDMCKAEPDRSQRDVINDIGSSSTFIDLHGDYRDADPARSSKAKSKLKSISDELAVVKTWPAADRVEGVSFEAHKVLNRLGSSAGHKILTQLAKEMGGPGNVTKAAVVARLKVADPDHVPQANGKKPAAGNQTVTTQQGAPLHLLPPLALAQMLGPKLTVGDLAKDADLAKAVAVIADVYEAFAQRQSAKASAKAPAKKRPARKTAARKSAPVKTPAPKRPSVKTPSVKVPAAK